MNNGQESRIKLESIKSSSTRQKTIIITKGASTNVWISRWTRVRRVEKQICPCDRMRMFCQNEGSIQRCSGNPHTHCDDWRIDMKQIVPNSVPLFHDQQMTWEESAPDGSGSLLKEPPDPECTEAPGL